MSRDKFLQVFYLKIHYLFSNTKAIFLGINLIMAVFACLCTQFLHSNLILYLISLLFFIYQLKNILSFSGFCGYIYIFCHWSTCITTKMCHFSLTAFKVSFLKFSWNWLVWYKLGACILYLFQMHKYMSFANWFSKSFLSHAFLCSVFQTQVGHAGTLLCQISFLVLNPLFCKPCFLFILLEQFLFLSSIYCCCRICIFHWVNQKVKILRLVYNFNSKIHRFLHFNIFYLFMYLFIENFCFVCFNPSNPS